MFKLKKLISLIILISVTLVNSQKSEREKENDFVKKYAPKNLDTHGFILPVDSTVPEVHQLFNDLEKNFYYYGDKKEFERKAARIIELDPEYPSGILMSSFYVFDSKKYKEKVTKAYELSKKSRLKSERDIIQAEYSLLVEEDYKKAQEYFQKVVDLYPDSVAAIWSLGMAYYYNEELDEALECYKKSIELLPGLPKGYEFVSVMYYQKKQYQKALEYLDIAEKNGANDKNDIYFSEYKGFLFYKNKMYEKVINYVNKVSFYGKNFKNSKQFKKVYNLSKLKLDSINKL